jgi:hypothetical protein
VLKQNPEISVRSKKIACENVFEYGVKWNKQKALKNKHPPQTWQVQADKV